jgi:hypothetical protein
VDAADATGSGRLDIIVTHLDMQLARFYQNLGDQTFDDATLRSKIGYSTYHMSGFGARFMDYDNDGARDVFMANGHVLDNIERYHADSRYAEPKLMFRNNGRGVFENVSDRLGPDFLLPRVSRGAAIADFDNDGDLDILVINLNEPPSLLRNDIQGDHHWVKVKLVGNKSNRSAIGARVTAKYGGRVQAQEVMAQSSYLSVDDRRLHFGLGGATSVDLEVRWPDGQHQTFPKISTDHLVTIEETAGIVKQEKLGAREP